MLPPGRELDPGVGAGILLLGDVAGSGASADHSRRIRPLSRGAE
jgi:hypothetical protein